MKALKKYFKNRIIAINQLIETPRDAYTAETFHQLRVETKKLNALFELINFSENGFKKKKLFKPFKQVFKRAGKVRTLQIEEEIVNKYISQKPISVYQDTIIQIQHEAMDNYFSLINPAIIAKLKKTTIKVFPILDKVNKKKVALYLEQCKKNIKKILSNENLLKKDMHQLRIQLKTYNYNCKIQALWKKNTQSETREVLADYLGKWHDCETTINDLQKTMDSGRIFQKEIKVLRQTKTKIMNESELLLNEINTLLNTSCAPFKI